MGSDLIFIFAVIVIFVFAAVVLSITAMVIDGNGKSVKQSLSVLLKMFVSFFSGQKK